MSALGWIAHFVSALYCLSTHANGNEFDEKEVEILSLLRTQRLQGSIYLPGHWEHN